jgi:hypothetical protein
VRRRNFQAFFIGEPGHRNSNGRLGRNGLVKTETVEPLDNFYTSPFNPRSICFIASSAARNEKESEQVKVKDIQNKTFSLALVERFVAVSREE